jgi:hypothetical protein
MKNTSSDSAPLDNAKGIDIVFWWQLNPLQEKLSFLNGLQVARFGSSAADGIDWAR